MYLLFSFLILFVSINNIVFSSFLLVLIIILSLFSKRKPLNEISFSFFFIFLVTPTLVGFILLLCGFDYTPFLKLVYVYVFFCFLVLLFSSFNFPVGFFSSAIDLAIKIHLFLFFFQMLSLYVFNYNIDFSSYLAGESNRVHGGVLQGFNFWRPSGLYNEPGTYATYFSILIYLSMFCSNFKPKPLYIFALISLYCTVSIFAYILSLPILFFLLIHDYQSLFNKIKYFLVALIMLPIFFVAYNYIHFRFFSENRYDISLDTKLNAVEFWLQQSFQRQILGAGFSYNDYGGLVDDSTLMFSFIFTYGIFSLPIFIALFWKSKRTAIFIFFILMSKTAIFSVFLGAAIGLFKNKRINYL